MKSIRTIAALAAVLGLGNYAQAGFGLLGGCGASKCCDCAPTSQPLRAAGRRSSGRATGTSTTTSGPAPSRCAVTRPAAPATRLRSFGRCLCGHRSRACGAQRPARPVRCSPPRCRQRQRARAAPCDPGCAAPLRSGLRPYLPAIPAVPLACDPGCALPAIRTACDSGCLGGAKKCGLFGHKWGWMEEGLPLRQEGQLLRNRLR